MPLATIDNLRERVAADNQKRSVADLGISDVTLQSALDSGEQDLRDALEFHGYTAAQIDAGDRLYEFHLNQSLYHLYYFGGVPHGYDLKQIEGFDRKKMVENPKYGWRVGGVVIWPGAAVADQPAGAVGHGRVASLTDVPTLLKTW
jgi:hypothetical protein